MRAPSKRIPVYMYVVWCDGGWTAFTNLRTARFWSEDGRVLVFKPSVPLTNKGRKAR